MSCLPLCRVTPPPVVSSPQEREGCREVLPFLLQAQHPQLSACPYRKAAPTSWAPLLPSSGHGSVSFCWGPRAWMQAKTRQKKAENSTSLPPSPLLLPSCRHALGSVPALLHSFTLNVKPLKIWQLQPELCACLMCSAALGLL